VRGSLTGSIVSTALLVLGGAMIAGGEGRSTAARCSSRSAWCSEPGCSSSCLPSGWHGDPERHELYVLTLPVAAALLAAYLLLTFVNLRRHAASPRAGPGEGAWSLRNAMLTLGIATAATALVSEILVHSLDAFGHAIGLSQFFVAAVIVALRR